MTGPSYHRDYMSMLGCLFAIWAFVAVGCGDDHHQSRSTADVSRLDGTYDTTVTARDGVQQQVVTMVTAEDTPHNNLGITMFLGANRELSVAGILDGVGALPLNGRVVTDDVVVIVTGSAAVTEKSGIVTVSGTISEQGENALTFIATRPTRDDARRRSGEYLFKFATSPSLCACASEVNVSIELAATGAGSIAETTDHTESGVVLGGLMQGSVLVTPGGRVRLVALYRSTMPIEGHSADSSLVLEGTVPEKGGGLSGSGIATIGLDVEPASIVVGMWTVSVVK